MGEVVTITFSVDAVDMHKALEEICNNEEKARRYRVAYPTNNEGVSYEAELENAQFGYLEILYPTAQYGDMKGSSAATQSGKAKLLLMMLYSKITVVGFRPITKGESEMQYLCKAMRENSLLQNRYHLVPTFEPLDVKKFGLTHVLNQSFNLSLLAFHCDKCVPPIDFAQSNQCPHLSQNLACAKKYTLANIGLIGGRGFNPRPLPVAEQRISTIKKTKPDLYAHVVATWEFLLSERYARYNPERITVADMKEYSMKVAWQDRRNAAHMGVYSVRGVRERLYFKNNGISLSGLSTLYADESMVAGRDVKLNGRLLTGMVYLGFFDLWDCLSSTYRQDKAHRSESPKERTTKSHRFLTPEEAVELFRPAGTRQRKWLLHTNPFRQFTPYPWQVPFDYRKKFEGEGACGSKKG